MGIANRDIKLENILLMDPSDRPTLKLCDFGYSKDEFMGSACKTMCGEHARLAAQCWGAQTAAAWPCILPVVLFQMGCCVKCLHRRW